jgi:hypothetical protein
MGPVCAIATVGSTSKGPMSRQIGRGEVMSVPFRHLLALRHADGG